MKLQNFFGCTVVAALSLVAASASAQKFSTPPAGTGTVRYSPDTAEIMKLVQAKTSDAVIISYIKANPRAYHLTSQEVSRLKRLGASPAVLATITEHDRLIDSNQYEWAAGTPEAKQAGSQTQGPPTKPKPTPAPEVVKLPPPAAESAPPPEPLKRPWTSSVLVERPPPGPKLELVPLSPGPEHAWIPGRWAWRQGQWSWQGGYWTKRPSPGLTWVNGYWAKHGKSWTWIEGRWR